jgi:hypothetical protein
MKLLKFILLFISIFSLYSWYSYANINLTVSPIKYEITAHTWSVITKTATLFNYSDQVHLIETWKSDFQANWTTWTPTFVRKSELVFTWQELSSWIDIDTDSFSINPWEKKDINFTITVPDNATPGWHYAWVFFKNNNSETSSWTSIWINIDYWVLILLNIEWDIIEEGEVEDTVITTKYSSSRSSIKDNCPIIDLTNSKYDWKCIDDFLTNTDLKDDIENLEKLEISDLELADFNIDFDTSFINEWNTHLKPTWKITLIDEDGKEIKWIWKELVKNEDWSIIWEKIVDYIPVNDNDGNVLPYTKRIFEADWKWFPYEGYDENWKKIIKYWTPEEYYTRQNVEERWFLLPWERVNERINHEKINAVIELWYTNMQWENIEFNSAKEFYVDYKEKYIWLNPYFFIILWFVFLIILLIWLIFRKKKVKCIECGKKIDKDMKVCPYCGKKQNSIFKKKKS